MSQTGEVSLSMLPSATPAQRSAAVSRLQHRLRAEIAARREVERENLRLRLQLKIALQRLARRRELKAATPHAEATAPSAPQGAVETAIAPLLNREREAALYEAVMRPLAVLPHDSRKRPEGNLQIAFREALRRKSGG